MTKNSYQKIFEKLQSNPRYIPLIKLLGNVCTFSAGMLYLGMIGLQLYARCFRPGLVLVLVPAVSLVVISIFRRIYNAKRPYEVYEFAPLIAKDTKGKSFPSRHVFSIFVIGSTLLWYQVVLGGFIMLMGCILAVIRVITGVHFPKDVICGMLVGIISGALAGLLL